MSHDTNKCVHVPEGTEFLHLLWEQEDECEMETDNRLPAMGKKAPACLEHIGTVLSFLDRMASCWWACSKGDHLIEYLCGRVASTGRAALRLTRFGFYDESLALCRSIDEIANLLCLFLLDPCAFDEWKASSRRDRLKAFSPVKVRCRIQRFDLSSPISQERYTLLCERAAHVHPETKPQSHNILGIPVAGAAFQDEGLLVSLNELAVGLCLVSALGALLLDLEKDVRNQIVTAAKCLEEQIGGATLTDIDSYRSHVVNSPTALQELERVAEALRRLQIGRHG